MSENIILRNDNEYKVELSLDQAKVRFGYEHGVPYVVNINNKVKKTFQRMKVKITDECLNQVDPLVFANYLITKSDPFLHPSPSDEDKSKV